MENRRRFERFRMNLVSFVRIAHAGGRLSDPFYVIVSNISAGGVLLMTETPLAVQAMVHIGIFLATNHPPDLASPRHNIHSLIKTTGRVVRCEEQGMAIQFDKGYSISPLFKRRRRDCPAPQL